MDFLFDVDGLVRAVGPAVFFVIVLYGFVIRGMQNNIKELQQANKQCELRYLALESKYQDLVKQVMRGRLEKKTFDETVRYHKRQAGLSKA